MRLLLVDDDRELVALLVPVLQKHGYVVDVAYDGKEASYLGDEKIYDLVILDIGLPERNGLDVLRGWRKTNNSVLVIMLTARNAWHERVDGFKAGADDYLGKPFHSDELMARISVLLRRAHQQSHHITSAGGLILDEELQSVILPDGEIRKLTGIEFRLLRYFLLNPNKVIPKTRLLDRVWDLESDKHSNIIEVYIKRLRQLIGKSVIETRRGQGYVFKG